jgi:broad specificity phosphatase PhoE
LSCCNQQGKSVSAVNTIFLVRHGENPANLTREFSHRRVDYPLTDKGVLQARQTAAYLRDVGLDALYCSPLKRAAQTAAVLGEALGLPATVLEGLRELNVGRLEDKPPTDENWSLHDRVLEQWRAGLHAVAFPGGEDYATARARMRAALRAALAGREGQRIVLVGHGGIFAVTLTDICPGVAPDDPAYRHSHNCSITEIRMERSETGEPIGELVRFADCSHLSGEAARLVRGLSEQPEQPVQPEPR